MNSRRLMGTPSLARFTPYHIVEGRVVHHSILAHPTSADMPAVLAWAASCQLRTQALQQTNWLFDHLVSNGEQPRREGDAESLGGFEIDDKQKLGRLHDGQVRRLLTPKNPPGIDTNLAI
jgi:hypothetical protein